MQSSVKNPATNTRLARAMERRLLDGKATRRSEEAGKSQGQVARMRKRGFFKELRTNRLMYLMSLPGVIYLLLFCYLPMVFVVIAFKDYNVRTGLLGSPWVGFKNFEFFFSDASKVWQTTSNTLALNSLFIVTDVVFQMGIAILLHEIRSKAFKKISQAMFFFPYFLSWVVVGAIIYNLFASEFGAVNGLLALFGKPPIAWYGHPEYWKAILVGAHVWKWTGYGALIYMAALAGIDSSIYEAAHIDGANRLQCIRSLTIPMLIPTATVLVLFSLGRIFFGDFGMVYGIVRDVGPLLQTTEVIDTYVYRAMRQTGDFSLTAAIGLWQSSLGIIVILVSNKLSKKINDGTSLF